ncbi:MAG: presenilin family intramembrane aspartyl protease [Candidatus Woesearchaeota archaeon]
MKHSLSITLRIVMLFILAQLIGLFILSYYVPFGSGAGAINEDVYFFEPPQVENESLSFLVIIIPFIIGTIFMLLIIKFNLQIIWKIWYFLGISFALLISLYPFIPFSLFVVYMVALLLTYIKQKFYMLHNPIELLLYAGIAAIFVPILNIFSIYVLLILIALYDAYAVWKSKHMVALATFQTNSNLFAGFQIKKKTGSIGKRKGTSLHHASSISKEHMKKLKNDSFMSYKRNHSVEENKESSSVSQSNAILGGGDILFPLLFVGTLMKYTANLYLGLAIILSAAFALFLLLVYAKKHRFYPAMPFIGAGLVIPHGLYMVLQMAL